MGGFIGGIGEFVGNTNADSSKSLADRQLLETKREMLLRLSGISMPELEELERNYLLAENMGELTPEMEQLFSQQDTSMGDIAVDPRLQQSQFDVLQQLAGLSQGGLSEADVMGLEQVRRDASAQDQARQQQVLQEMQARGQGGSGNELISRLKSSQVAADRASQEGMQIAQMAQQRALQALMNQGNMASSMRSQDFGEQSDVAKARDTINRFNTANQQNVQQRNVGAQNTAQEKNLNTRQGLEDRRVQTRNVEQNVNKDLLESQYGKRVGREQMLNDQRLGVANQSRSNVYDQEQRNKERREEMTDMMGSMTSFGM